MRSVSLVRLILFPAVLTIAMVSTAAIAAADPEQLTIRDIVTQQTQLRQQAATGKGAFAGMAVPERRALLVRQDRVIQVLAGIRTLEDLPPDQRVAVFNDLEWIKHFVIKAEDERMVCEYVYLTGSHIPRSVCMSAKERERLTDATRGELRKVYKCDDCQQ